MAKLAVLKTDSKSLYILEKENKEQISLQIELYGVPKLEKGDFINISDELLDTASVNFVQPYAFENCDITNFSNLPKNEKMIVERKNKTILLKRIYG